MKIWKRDYYEKLLGIKPAEKTVSEYQVDIQRAQQKIEELQSQCSHDTYQVVFYSWRPGALHPSHVCSRCTKHLGDATEEESEALWDSFNKRTQSGVSVSHTIGTKNDD